MSGNGDNEGRAKKLRAKIAPSSRVSRNFPTRLLILHKTSWPEPGKGAPCHASPCHASPCHASPTLSYKRSYSPSPLRALVSRRYRSSSQRPASPPTRGSRWMTADPVQDAALDTDTVARVTTKLYSAARPRVRALHPDSRPLTPVGAR